MSSCRRCGTARASAETRFLVWDEWEWRRPADRAAVELGGDAGAPEAVGAHAVGASRNVATSGRPAAPAAIDSDLRLMAGSFSARVTRLLVPRSDPLGA